MLDYEWSNPSPIMLNDAVSVPVTADEPDPQPDHYSQTFTEPTNNNNTHYLDPNNFLHHTHNPTHHYLHNPTHFTSVYDPRSYTSYSFEPDGLTGLNSLNAQTGFMFIPKTEPELGPAGRGVEFSNDWIGLNLGGRTYFSSAEDELVNRLYCRSRAVEPAAYVSLPRCQAEGCNADLTHAKHYHRRHKVCEYHSKASTVIAAGLTQRFCQQCSRFHLLLEFDNGKRSCRRRLADHNRRRRKSSQNQDHSKSITTLTGTQSSSSGITSRYESDSKG